ncbi:hypothetical protein BDW22DRAFT_1340843, partial [Trametopsis cervina]
MSSDHTDQPQLRRSTRERHQTDFLRGSFAQPKPRRRTPVYTPTPTPPPSSPPTSEPTQMASGTKTTTTREAAESAAPTTSSSQQVEDTIVPKVSPASTPPARRSPTPPPPTPSEPSHHTTPLSDIRSVPPHSDPDFNMSLSDVNKAFADVGKLTGPDTWPMWKFRTETAMQTIMDFYSLRAGQSVPGEITRSVFNVITGHIADNVMANYMTEKVPHVLMSKLRERFDPKTTVSDANEIFSLFHLRRPIFEMDKLLDDATNIVSRLLAKGIDIPDHIFYSAIIGIIPPAYAQTRASYEAGVRSITPRGQQIVFKPHALIAELRREFNNWRLTHPPKAAESKGSSTLVPRDKHNNSSSKDKGVERTAKTSTHARATAAPYSKAKPEQAKPPVTCYNCNEEGHTTPTCPKPWTEKSKAAMKAKGITRKSVAAAAKGKQASGAAASTSTATGLVANVASSSNAVASSSKTGKSSQSAWIESLTDSDVDMHVSTHFTAIATALPLYATLSSDESVHVIDTGASIHCTPYRNLLFNVHSVPTVLLTTANSEQLILNLAGDMVVEM